MFQVPCPITGTATPANALFMPRVYDGRVRCAAVVFAVWLAALPALALPGDPIEGAYDYRTTSNCGALGVGEVTFVRLPDGGYREEGWVRWEHSGLVVRWWGTVRFDRARRVLTGRI